MPFWFGKKKIAVSPGGSTILSYDEPGKRTVGFPEESTLDDFAVRETVYNRLFGTSDHVSHEIVPQVPHIDVYIFKPSTGREFHTLVTGGMSDCALNLPREVGGKAARRVELIFYCE